MQLLDTFRQVSKSYLFINSDPNFGNDARQFDVCEFYRHLAWSLSFFLDLLQNCFNLPYTQVLLNNHQRKHTLQQLYSMLIVKLCISIKYIQNLIHHLLFQMDYI